MGRCVPAGKTIADSDEPIRALKMSWYFELVGVSGFDKGEGH